MGAPVVNPVQQYADANGQPYANGLLATYIPGTSTAKATWQDQALTVLNTDPIRLDPTGSATMWGDGDYRLVLFDAAGNQIFDTVATTIVSAAMAPVVSAPTVADARHQLGVDDAVAAEAAARAAADSEELTERVASDAVIVGQLDVEITNRADGDAALLALIEAIPPVTPTTIVFGGSGITDITGHARVTFPAAYTSTPVATCTVVATAGATATLQVATDTAGIDVYAFEGGVSSTVPTHFYWISAGAPP